MPAPGDTVNSDDRVHDLYVRYYRRVVSYFVKSFRFSQEDARDLAQDVFMRVHIARDQYRDEAETGYIMTAAKRVGLNKLRANRTQSRGAPVQSLDDVVKPPATGPRQERDLQLSQLEAAITRLRHGQRVCLLLYRDGFHYTEIAATLGITVDAVKSRLKDTRHALRRMLTEDPAGIEWPADRADDGRPVNGGQGEGP